MHLMGQFGSGELPVAAAAAAAAIPVQFHSASLQEAQRNYERLREASQGSAFCRSRLL